MTDTFEALAEKVSLTDILSENTEHKQPPKTVEAPEPQNIINEALQHKEENEVRANNEMTAEMMVSAIDGILQVGNLFLNSKASRKMTAEEWHKLDQIKSKKAEDLDEDERQLLFKSTDIERKLDSAKSELDLEEDEERRLKYAAELFAEANDIKATANSFFYLEIAKILLLKGYTIYSF